MHFFKDARARFQNEARLAFQEVKKETFDYISRGFDLNMKRTKHGDEYNLPAHLEFSNGNVEPVIVKVETVW